LTSLKVFQVRASVQFQSFEVTSIKGRVITSLQVRIKDLPGRELVVSFTDFEFGIHRNGESHYGAAEESDGKHSEFGCVLHDESKFE
jgi:hypothetical protein